MKVVVGLDKVVHCLNGSGRLSCTDSCPGFITGATRYSSLSQAEVAVPDMKKCPQCQWAEYAPDGDGDCDSFGYFRCENCGTVLAAGNGRRCLNCGASNTPD